MPVNLLEEYEEYNRAGKKAKASRNKIMYSKSTRQISYYDGIPTPVVFKIIKNIDKATGKTNRNVGYATMKALEYIANDKEELENGTVKDIDQTQSMHLETDDGRILTTKQEIYNFYKEWEETFTDRKNGKDFEHCILSTKESSGKTDKQITDAARQSLRKKFGDDGYNYGFNLHKNTEHVHVHVIMRVHNSTKDKRLDINTKDFDEVKDIFASELRSKGLNYENYINFNKILGINSQLQYLEQNDLSWFQANVAKLKDIDVDALGNRFKILDGEIKHLTKLQEKNKDNPNHNKKAVSQRINRLYTNKNMIIYRMNGLEYNLKQATKNYKSLIKKRDSIEWYLKQTNAYKEIDKRTNEAEQLVIQKKLELNKAQLYISSAKAELTFTSKIKEDTLYHLHDYLKDDTKKDINSLLYRLNTLETKMPKSNLAKEIKELKKDILDDSYHTTIKSDFTKVLNEVKNSNKAITVNDEFTNNFIKNIDKKLDVVINNVKNNKDVSARDMKSVGFDLAAFETFTKAYQVDHIKNTPENLKEFEKFKEYFDEKNYQALIQEIKENKLTDRNLNYALEKATNKENIKLLPVDLKRSLELEKRDVEVEILNIDSYHKYLNNNQNKINNETISSAIFNSGKFFETISNRLNNELGLEIKTIDQLSQNINNIGKQSELRKLIDSEIHKTISNFREVHKLKDNNKFQEVYEQYETSNLDSFSKEDYEDIEKQNYKEIFSEIKSLEFENLSMENNKNDFYKLFAVISNAKEAKDIDTLVEAYKLDSLSDKSQMIKDFGKALNVNTQEIKKNIWFNNIEKPTPEVWDKTNDFVLETLVHDYKEQFIEEYVNEISIEYLLYMSEKKEITEELIQKNIDEFNKGLEDFKEEYFSNEEYQKNIESVEEHLKYGEFKSAREVIENSNLGEDDIKILDSYYEEHIDKFANDLESAEEHIHKENELNQKTYLLEDFAEDNIKNNIDKERQVLVKPKEIIQEPVINLEVPTAKKEPLSIPKEQPELIKPIEKKTTTIKEASPDKKSQPTNYDKLKEQYDYKEKEFINKLILMLDKSLNEQKTHDHKDMMFKASKTLSNELKRNVNQIEDTKRVLEEMPKAYKVEKKCLDDNLNTFFNKARETNNIVKQYVDKIEKSDFDIKSRLEYKLGLYNELAKYRYSERITNAIPGIKNEMVDRGIEHFKLINKQLETPKLDKEIKKDLIDKSSQLLKDFNKLNPTWKQERTITKLHKEQVKGLNQRQKGIER